MTVYFFYDKDLYMADIIQKTTQYRIKQIELAEAEYYKSLITALDRIEREVVSLASRLPLTDGKLIELQAAIAIRPQIKAILEREYLAWSDTVVRKGFNKQAKRIEKTFKRNFKDNIQSAEAGLSEWICDITLEEMLEFITELREEHFLKFIDAPKEFLPLTMPLCEDLAEWYESIKI